MALTNLLSARERLLLEAVLVAETDDEVARAVLELGDALVTGGALVELSEALSDDEQLLYRVIHAQAAAHVEGPEADASGVEASTGTPLATASRAPEKVEAVLCLSPEDESIVGPLMQATQTWLRGMDGDEGMVLLDALTPTQREAIQSIRAAGSEDEAAQAVLSFQAALQHSANWMGMVGRLSRDKIQGMLQIWTMAGHHLRK